MANQALAGKNKSHKRVPAGGGAKEKGSRGESQAPPIVGVEEAIVAAGSVQAQAEKLADNRFQSAQRQAMVARVGRQAGNRRLQEVLEGVSLERDKPPASSESGLIQLSPLSDELSGLWNPQRKSPFFDRLRALSAQQRADPDLNQFVESGPGLGSDDRWLARRILRYGPEPNWPASELNDRHRLADVNQWAPEPGGVTAELTAQNEGVTANTTAYWFPGVSSQRALIVGGMHGSEMSAVQVAERLITDLLVPGRPRPFFTVIIVPRLFAGNVARAETAANARPASPISANSSSNLGRYSRQSPTSTDPNRQFPSAGTPFDPAHPVDAMGRPIEPANIILLELIQRYQPTRVANLHAVHTVRSAGIYADPRTDDPGTNTQGRACGFGPDRDLALAMSARAARGGARVPGNRRSTARGASNRADENATYPLDPAVVRAGARQPRAQPGGQAYQQGTSFGAWGTTAVEGSADASQNRQAMTVITVEVATTHRIEDITAGDQAAREAELNAHSAALREIFLGEPGQDGLPVIPPCPAPPSQGQ
jgi:predicted deacylase